MSHLNPSPDTSRHYFRMMLESQKDHPPSHTVIGLLYAELIRSLDRLIAALAEAPEARADARRRAGAGLRGGSAGIGRRRGKAAAAAHSR